MLREKELVLLENLKTDNERKTEEIQQLRKNQLIGQASGEESITITDGAFAFANILEETEIEVEGEKRKAYVVKLPQGLSKQQKRTGYNLLNLENEGKEITLDYTSEYSIKYENCKVEQTLKAGTYTLALKVKSLANGSINAVSLKNVDTTVATFSGYTTTTTTEKFFIKTITVDTDITFNRISLQNAQIGTYIIKEIIILEGTYTAENLPKYEEYGLSPSINFPSEIENFRAWNLFNAYISKQNIGGVDVEFDEDTGILTLNGTCTETKQISFDRSKNKIKTKVNTKYTFEVFKVSGKYTFGGTSEHGESSVQLWDNSSGTWKYPYQLIFNSFGSANKISVSHTYDVDILYNQVQFKLEAGDIFDDFKIKIQFSEGDSKEYLSCGDIFIFIKNKNYVSSYINDWEEGHYSQTTGLKEPYANRLRLKELIKVQPDTAYYANTFSNNTYNLVLREYDKYKNIINNVGGASDGGIFKTTKDTKFISVSLYNRLDAGAPLYFEDFKKLFEAGTIKPFMCLNSESNKDYVSGQKQNYNLHINDIELNGINDARDSLVIELKDENMSCKKIKKLYYSKKYIEKVFTGEANSDNQILSKHSSIYSETRGFFQIKLENKKNSINSILAKDYMKSNYMKVVDNNGAQNTFNNNTEGLWNEGNSIFAYLILPFTTVIDSNNWLKELNMAGKPLKILYPLETPELVDITDNTELVKDVEYLINNFKTFKEVTHVEVDNGYIDLEYVKSTELALKNIQQQIDNISALMLEGGTGNA